MQGLIISELKVCLALLFMYYHYLSVLQKNNANRLIILYMWLLAGNN